MRLWSVEANDYVDVPDDQVNDALLSKKFGLDSSAQIHVQLGSGEYGVVEGKNIFKVLRAGGSYDTKAARLERKDYEQYGDSAAKALGLGALRGVSLGLSDWALTKSGAMTPEELRKIDEYNAGASAVGEYGSLLLPGPGIVRLLGKIPGVGKAVAGAASALPSFGVARLGEKVTKGTVKQLQQRAPRLGDRAISGIAQGAGVATEAALGGVGFALSEQALGRGDELAEELQSIGAGGLFGFALGGAIGSFKPIAKAMVGDPAKGVTEAGEKMVDSVQGLLLRHDPAELNALRDPTTAEFVIEKAKRKTQREDIAGATTKALTQVEDAFQALNKIASGPSKRGKVDEIVKQGYESVDPATRILDDIANNAQALADADVLEQFQRPVINRISAAARNSAEKIRKATLKASNGGNLEALNGLVYKELDDMKRVIGKNLDTHFKTNFQAMKPQAQNTFKNAGGFYDRLRTVLEDENVFGDALAGLQREINVPYTAVLTAKGTKTTGFDANFMVRGQSVVDPKKALSYVRDLPKEMRVPELAIRRRALDTYLDNLTSFRAAIGKHYGAVPKSVDDAIAAIGPMRESHKAHFQREMLARELEDVLNSQGAAVNFLRAGASLGGKVPFAGRMVEAAASIVDPGIALRKRAELVMKKAKAQEKLQKSVERTLRAIKTPGKEPARALRTDYRRRIRAMGSIGLAETGIDKNASERELTTDAILSVHELTQPDRMAQIIEEETKDYRDYPEHEQAIAQRISTTFTYLANLVKPIRFQIDPVTGEQQMMASDSELAKVAQGMEALGNPLEALAVGMETGTTSHETVQAIRMLYPRLFARYAAEVQKGVLEQEKPPTNQQRLELSVLFNQPMSPYMQPGFVAAMQAVHGKPPTGAQQPRGYTGALSKQPERELLPLQSGMQV